MFSPLYQILILQYVQCHNCNTIASITAKCRSSSFFKIITQWFWSDSKLIPLRSRSMTPGGPMTLACTFCGATFKALHKFSRFYLLHFPTAPYKSKKINKTITKISVHLAAQLHIGTNWNKSQLLSFQSLLRHFILTNISFKNCYTHIITAQYTLHCRATYNDAKCNTKTALQKFIGATHETIAVYSITRAYILRD